MNILTGKTIKTSNYFSRYNGFAYYYNKGDEKNTVVRDSRGLIQVDKVTGKPLTTKSGKYHMSTSSWLKDTDDYTLHTVKEGETYDSIALRYYNNPTYYWIICDFNKIINPFINPVPGDILYIPSKYKKLEFKHY